MSWQQADPNSGGTYSNYGNYNDGQFGGADSASYDMFEVGETNEPQTATYSESGFGSGRSSAFYDPNAYASEGTTHQRG